MIDHIKVVGFFDDYNKGGRITLIVEMPNGEKNEQQLYAAEGSYNTSFALDRDSPLGEYKITTIYGNDKDEIIFTVANEMPEKTVSKKVQEIPQWVRNNAEWWANDLISEDDFVNGINYMVENRLIRLG